MDKITDNDLVWINCMKYFDDIAYSYFGRGFMRKNNPYCNKAICQLPACCIEIFEGILPIYFTLAIRSNIIKPRIDYISINEKFDSFEDKLGKECHKIHNFLLKNSRSGSVWSYYEV